MKNHTLFIQNLSLAILSAAAILVAPAPASAEREPTSVVRGQVNFTGNIPAPARHTIAGDRFCEEANKKNPIMKQEIVINPNKTLANVVVWIASGGPDYFYEPKDGSKLPPVILTQRDCKFVPRVVALHTNQKLIVKNVDPTLHNVNAQPRNNPRLNNALIPGGDPATLSFANPEISVKLKSDIHPWMIAYAAVFDHPGYTVVGEDGRFEIPDIPQGEYVLQAWHEKFGIVKVPILVNSDSPTNVIITYTNEGSKSGAQVDPSGNPTTGTIEKLPEYVPE